MVKIQKTRQNIATSQLAKTVCPSKKTMVPKEFKIFKEEDVAIGL
jgi:hypothetical protein